MSDKDEVSGQVGIVGYDLQPPAPLYPTLSVLAGVGGRVQSRPHWTAPPVPDGHARVELDDDYYAGAIWNHWKGTSAEYPARVFDLPAEQVARWEKALEDYAAMQEEIEVLRRDRLAKPGWAPEGWKRGEGYQVQP